MNDISMCVFTCRSVVGGRASLGVALQPVLRAAETADYRISVDVSRGFIFQLHELCWFTLPGVKMHKLSDDAAGGARAPL